MVEEMDGSDVKVKLPHWCESWVEASYNWQHRQEGKRWMSGSEGLDVLLSKDVDWGDED